MTPEQISRLLHVAALRKARDTAAMARVSARQAALATERAELGQQARAEAPRMGPQAAEDLAVHARFTEWTGRRRTEMDGEAARSAEAARRAQSLLRRSFGQVQVLEELHRRSIETEAQSRRSRSEREGRPPED